MRIGNNLRALRKKQGLSLRKLQNEVGISHNTLGSYERNTIQPTIENCYKLCKYFEVPIEYLILGENCSKNYKDIELVELFNLIDKMESEDRETIKKYVYKYIKSKKEFEQVKNEAK